MASTAFSDDDGQHSEVLAEIQKLESILLEQLDKETARFGSSSASSISKGITGDFDIPSTSDLDAASSINFSQYLDAQQDARSSVAGARSIAQSSAYWSHIDGSKHVKEYDEASDLWDNQSCTSLRKELSQVVTPYGHVSKHVQAYEELTPAPSQGDGQFAMPQAKESSQHGMYRTGTFAGTDGSVVGVAGSVVSSSAMEELTQQTAALSTTGEDVQSTISTPSRTASSFSAAASQSTPLSTPNLEQHSEQQALLSQTQKIKSLLQNLESQLTQVSVAATNMASSPPSMGLEIQNSIRSLSFLEDSLKQTLTPTIPEDDGGGTSSFAAHSRTRLNNIRQKLWGGPSPVQQRQQQNSRSNDFARVEEDYDEDVDNASVVGQVSTDIVHLPREEIGCFDTKPKEEQPVRPRDDYFSAAYQNAFACSSAYHLDLPEPGTANISSTPNATGGKNYYYYYPPPEVNNVACCQIPPVEKLLTALKRLEVRVASCHANHLRRRQQQQHRFPDGAVLQQYELADLDLSNPARAERYYDL